MVWNKGHTKETHPSIKKISETMKKKRIDNFSEWREKNIGRNKNIDLKKNGDLAELLGAILGDGSIYQFARTQYVRISCNSNNPQWVKRCERILEKVLQKKPSSIKRKNSNCIDITLYQKNLSGRLGLEAGPKINKKIVVPGWILKRRKYVLRYLRGLYETDGCLSSHKDTYTYKFIFSNRNRSLLNQVYSLWKYLGFNPHRTADTVQISRKNQVEEASNLIHFRKY